MGQFGEFLLQQGAITEHQLAEALHFQAVYGGRIGTVVADLGYLVVDELAAYLSDFHHVPLPPLDWLDSPDPRAVQIIPLPLIRRCKVLPLHLELARLHVAMLDPTSEEQLDFLRMAADREVVPYVLPERKLLYWLEVHLGIDRPPRFLGMVTRPRGRELSQEEIASATPLANVRKYVRAKAVLDDPAEEPLPVTATVPEKPGSETAWQEPRAPTAAAEETPAPPAEEILLLDELVSEAPEAPRWAASDEQNEEEETSRDASGRVSVLEAQLYASDNRDQIIGLALQIARSYSRAAALFVARRGVVSGFRGDGGDIDQALRQIELPLSTPSIFTQPALTCLPFRGSPPADGIDGRMMTSLRREEVQEVFVHPIVIGDRTVNLFYADNGSDAFGETSVAALTALCDCLARAYGRLIVQQKKGAAV